MAMSNEQGKSMREQRTKFLISPHDRKKFFLLTYGWQKFHLKENFPTSFYNKKKATAMEKKCTKD